MRRLLTRFVLRTLYRLRRLYWQLRRPVLLGVRVVPIGPNGHVLLVEHSYVAGWYVPGGAVDAGETLSAAAARELREEVGVDAEVKFVQMQTFFLGGRSDHIALFVARVNTEFEIDEVEISQARFFSVDALPPLPAVTQRHLEAVGLVNQ